MTPKKKYSVASFETAQRLHEAGVKLKAAFWYDSDGELHIEVPDEYETIYLRLKDKRCFTSDFRLFYPAPTFQELWDALPKEIALSYGNFLLSITPLQDIYSIGYGSLFAITINGLTEAAAELLLHLKEKGIWHIK